MAESTNTFINSKMNKDLDSRLVPNGDYRDAENVSISRSEGSDVGALENTLGTIQVTDFGLSSTCKVEIIGKITDQINNRIFVLLTDYTDNSPDKLSNKAYLINNTSTNLGDATCAIGVFDANTGNGSIIVSGPWLNFSTTHIVTGINLLENLLFWTDNRNQPRKINVETAIGNPNYYYTEDHVSVAKLYPWQVISMLDKTDSAAVTGGNNYKSLMNDVVSKSLPGWPKATSTVIVNAGSDYEVSATLTNIPTSGGTGTGLTVDGTTNGSGAFTSISINNPGKGYSNGDTITIISEFKSPGTPTKIAIVEGKNGKGYPIAPDPSGYTFVSGPGAGTKVEWGQREGFIYGTSIDENNRSLVTIDPSNPGSGKKVGDILKVPLPSASLGFEEAELEVLEIDFAGAFATFTIVVQDSPNPEKDATYEGDEEYMKDRFVRFSYRFKFDDGEYSLLAPFTQIAFIPEQDGFFINSDEEVAYKSTDLNLMRNKVNRIQLDIPSPATIFQDQSISNAFGNNASWNTVFDLFKITEVDILYKEAQSEVIKVIDTIPQSVFSRNNLQYISYVYEGKKPYKVLNSKEIVRVSDITPLRAISQEIISNRVVYGGYLDKGTEPSSIKYNASIENKSEQVVVSSGSSSILNFMNTDYRKEYQNHNLKQNRTYQVGVVLADRYGRQSNVILSEYDVQQVTNKSGSTVYNPYKDETFISTGSMKTWSGNSLAVEFDELIPDSIDQLNYPGLFYGTEAVDKTALGYENSTGWYSLKFVVKQSQQEYYNVYLPGLLRGVPNPNTLKSSLSSPYLHSVLQSDNINKVPRSLIEVGPEQQIFSTSKPNSLQSDLNYIKTQLGNADLQDIDPNTLDKDSIQDEKIIKILKERDRLKTKLSLVDKDNSAVEMYLRVNNFYKTAFASSTSSGQYFPIDSTSNTISNPDGVVLIGKGTDLGLYEIDPNPVNSNEISTEPSLAKDNFLDATSSPLIMKVQSTNIDNNPGVEAENMIPALAVYETTPVESSLDIYWETSSSFPIQIFNELIIEPGLTAGTPFSMADNAALGPNFDLPYMTKNEGSSISGSAFVPFQVVNSVGSPLSVSTVNLVAVFDELGNNEISNWTLTGTNPNLNLETNKFLYSDPNNRFRNFNFEVTTSTGVFASISFNEGIKNLPAVINSPAGGSNFTVGLIGGVVVSPTGVNGAAGPLDETKDLNWRIAEQEDASGNEVNYFNLATGTGVQGSCSLNLNPITALQASAGPFSIAIELNDRPFPNLTQYQDRVEFTVTVS